MTAQHGTGLQIEGVDMRLGVWWLEAAVRGGVDALPLVNLRYISSAPDENSLNRLFLVGRIW